MYPPEPITVARGQVLCVGPGLENKATLEPHPKHKNPGVREESLLQAKSGCCSGKGGIETGQSETIPTHYP